MPIGGENGPETTTTTDINNNEPDTHRSVSKSTLWSINKEEQDRLAFVDSTIGAACFTAAGTASVSAQLSAITTNATTFTTVAIRLPARLKFHNHPEFVSDEPGVQFVFPVLLDGNLDRTTTTNVFGKKMIIDTKEI